MLGIPFETVIEEREDTVLETQHGHLSVADKFFSLSDAQWLKPASLPRLPLTEWTPSDEGIRPTLTDTSVPVLFAVDHEGAMLTRHDEDGVVSLQLSLDVFGACFFLLSRYEEVVATPRDPHGRFPASEAVAVRAGFLERPLVNEYAEILWACLSAIYPGLTSLGVPGPNELLRRSPTNRDTDDCSTDFVNVGAVGDPLRITAVEVTGSTVDLDWQDVAADYVVEERTNLTEGDWQPSPGTAWPFGGNSWTTARSADPRKFYRVRHH